MIMRRGPRSLYYDSLTLPPPPLLLLSKSPTPHHHPRKVRVGTLDKTTSYSGVVLICQSTCVGSDVRRKIPRVVLRIALSPECDSRLHFLTHTHTLCLLAHADTHAKRIKRQFSPVPHHLAQFPPRALPKGGWSGIAGEGMRDGRKGGGGGRWHGNPAYGQRARVLIQSARGRCDQAKSLFNICVC